MYAIVDIAGQQFKVEKNQKVFVHRLEAEEGSKVDFDKVMLLEDNGVIQIGSPTVENTVVTAKVVSHVKSDKVKIFKKKRRKGYQVLNGHRQSMTEIFIEDISAGKSAKAAKKTTKKAEKVVAETGDETEKGE
jgi:large subunit ribosomal protein L21